MGPLCHLAVMKQVASLLNSSMKIAIKPGNLVDVVEPDLKAGQHDDWTGQISGRLFNEIKEGVRVGKDISRPVRWVAHFILDYHAFTQSFPGYSTKDDGRIDLFAEFVTDKNYYTPVVTNYASSAAIQSAVTASIAEMNSRYSAAFRRNWGWFIMGSSFRTFIRTSIQRSAGFTASIVKYAKSL